MNATFLWVALSRVTLSAIALRACVCVWYARALWQQALSVERDALIGALFNRAIEGDTKAAQFLLAARHGITEKQADQFGERVNITFQLPAALNQEQYSKLMQVSTQELPKLTDEFK